MFKWKCSGYRREREREKGHQWKGPATTTGVMGFWPPNYNRAHLSPLVDAQHSLDGILKILSPSHSSFKWPKNGGAPIYYPRGCNTLATASIYCVVEIPDGGIGQERGEETTGVQQTVFFFSPFQRSGGPEVFLDAKLRVFLHTLFHWPKWNRELNVTQGG